MRQRSRTSDVSFVNFQPPKNDCGGEFTRRILEGGRDPSTNQERSLFVSINTNNPPQRHVLQGEQLKVEHVFCALIIERERGGGRGNARQYATISAERLISAQMSLVCVLKYMRMFNRAGSYRLR